MSSIVLRYCEKVVGENGTCHTAVRIYEWYA